jgi:hypothetical protein
MDTNGISSKIMFKDNYCVQINDAGIDIDKTPLSENILKAINNNID